MDYIPIDEHLQRFYNHLLLNERTIFSAKFGDGKTEFISKFKEKYKENFYFVTLYPVNYSVADNKDVFEYIKRDILLQLAEDCKLNPIDFSAICDSAFNWENMKKVLGFLLGSIPVWGEPMKKLVDITDKFFHKYNENKITFEKYSSIYDKERGGIYEHDGYTILIEGALKYIKEHESKQCVLIIEDLDRIDPAHLFRILNVLGAHIDRPHFTANKFGFDKIVTVFDYEVTKHIFHHFYGNNANYNGYINKFISIHPFHYSIHSIAQDFLKSYIYDNCLLNERHLSLSRHTVIENEAIVNLKDQIGNMSVRDVVHILDGIDYEKNVDEVELCIGTKVISTAPIINLLIVLKRMGLKVSKEWVSKYLLICGNNEMLNILGVFLLNDVRLDSGDYFEYKQEYWGIRKTINKDNVVTKCEFFKDTISGYKISNIDIDKITEKALALAYNYIK